MAYVVDYCIISTLYLGVTAFFYLRQRRVPSLRGRLYGWLLILGLCSLVLDILSVLPADNAPLYPVWALYAVNLFCLLSVQTSGPVFLFYTLVLSGSYPRMSSGMRAVVLIPYITNVILLLLSPFCQAGIFYINADNIYTHGSSYHALYIVMAAYLVSSAVLVLWNRNKIQRKKQYTIYLFLSFIIVAMVIQLSWPGYLVNTTANALALTMMYHVLQSPSEHVDPLTEVFNRAALPILMQDLSEQNEHFSVLLFPLDALPLINHTLGIRKGDLLLIGFAEYLQQTFPNCAVLRVAGDVFAVIDYQVEKLTERMRLEAIQRAIPVRWQVESDEIQLTSSLAVLNSEDYESNEHIISTIDYIIQGHRHGESQTVILADEAFLQNYAKQAAMEEALERALDNERVEVWYQPIHDGSGKLVALEALCRINDPQLGMLPPDVFVRIAEQNGSIHRLGAQVIEEVCRFIRSNQVDAWGLDHIGVNLSIIQCMQEDLSDRICERIRAYGLGPGLLSFEITETEAATSMPVVRRNMQRLANAGYSFLLDDFGTGYANFGYIAKLPFDCVKIDKSILWKAGEDKAQMAFLSGINDVLKRLGLLSVCEGVETREQAELVAGLGISMQQGYYYSKPLPPARLVEYAEALGRGTVGGNGGGIDDTGGDNGIGGNDTGGPESAISGREGRQ